LRAGVRGPGAAVQLWGGLEGADLGEAVQRSGRSGFVAMMESADFGQLDDLTHRRRLDVSRVGSVFVQGEVGSIIATSGAPPEPAPSKLQSLRLPRSTVPLGCTSPSEAGLKRSAANELLLRS
jgi:hypothetical protein